MAFPANRNGSNSMTPQVMAGFLDSNYLYGAYIKTGGGAVAYRWHEPTNVYQTIDLSTVASNQLELPMFDLTDDHYSLVVGVDSQDNVFITGNHHDNLSSPAKYHFLQCTNVSDFTNAASWAAASTAHFINLATTPSAGNYTYSIFDRLTNGTLLHFMSQSEAPGNSRGRDWLAFKRVAGTWSALLASGGHFATSAADDPQGTTADRVYINGIVVEPRGANEYVHAWGIWRTEDELAASQQAPFYIYANASDLGTWYYKRNGGDLAQTMPITWANRSTAEITSAPATSTAIRLGIYIDPSTFYPAVTVRDINTATYKRLSWNGTAWASTDATARSGQPREFDIGGVLWVRHNTTGRVALTRVSDSKQILIGSNVVTAGENFSANPCPIWLRERGVFATCIGDGDTPLVFTLGNSVRVNN